MTNCKMNSTNSAPSIDAMPPLDRELILVESDLLPGDVLLFRLLKPGWIQRRISIATNSPYTHAAIYIGDNLIADANPLCGVAKRELADAMNGSRCAAILRSQCVFSQRRVEELKKFVDAVLYQGKFYNINGILKFQKASEQYFTNQLEFIRENYGKVTSTSEFVKMSFFCSAFIVACYAVVDIIDTTAQAAYRPDFFSPGHLHKDPTFGWLLGYLVPQEGSVPADDPAMNATQWRNCLELRWWKCTVP